MRVRLWTGGLPARVEGMIAERIGRLDEELREMLTAASVEDEEFTAEAGFDNPAGAKKMGKGDPVSILYAPVWYTTV